MEVAKWLKETSDEEILAMLFQGEIEGFLCPYCEKEWNCTPSDTTIDCGECGETYYSPIYDPKLDV
jgi:hypothetical protein